MLGCLVPPTPAQRPKHPTRTCKHSDMTYVILRREKKQSPSKAAIEISPEPISYNARFRPATNCANITTHAIIATAAQQQALRNQTPPASPPRPPRVAKWIAGTLSAVDRQTLFARLGPQRSTADCSAVVSPQNATAMARYLPEMQAAALRVSRVHPMWHVKSKQGLCALCVP